MQYAKTEFFKLLGENPIEYLPICFTDWEKEFALFGTAHTHQCMTSVLRHDNFNHTSIVPYFTAKAQPAISSLSLVLKAAKFTISLI